MIIPVIAHTGIGIGFSDRIKVMTQTDRLHQKKAGLNYHIYNYLMSRGRAERAGGRGCWERWEYWERWEEWEYWERWEEWEEWP